MAETQMEKTELKFLGGLFRNKSKKGDIYYSGKSEDGTSWEGRRREQALLQVTPARTPWFGCQV